MCNERLLVEHRSGPRGEYVEDERRGVLAVGFDRDGLIVEFLDLVEHIRLRQADPGQDGGRTLVEQHGTLDRPCHVVGRERVARMELQAGAQFEREREAIGAHSPRLRNVRVEFRRILQIDAYQAVVSVGDVLLGHEFVHFARVERREFVEQGRHDEHVFRRLRISLQRGKRHEHAGCGRCGDELGEPGFHACAHCVFLVE